MAVAHVTSSQSHASAAFSVSEASFSWTHTTSTDPQGVLILVFQGVSATDAVTSVTYDGTTVPAVSGGRATDTATEPGSVAAYFLGSGVPTTNNPTVVVNRTNNTTTMWAVCSTVTAGTTTEVVGTVLTQENGAIAEQSVDDGTTGVNSVRYAGVFYGGATPAPAGTNSTLLGTTNDAGAYGWTAVQETTAGQGSRLVGCTQATSDDRAGVHLAVRELYVPPGPTVADAQESVWNTTTTPKTVTFAGAVAGDRILMMATGDASNSFGDNHVTACTTSTTAGSTGSWTEPAEAMSSVDADWLSSATTTVSSTGSVTVSVDRTKNGAEGGQWGLYALLLRGDGGIGNIGGVTTLGTAQVASLTVSADSLVAFISGDWDVNGAATALTPGGGVTVERSVLTDYTVCAGYWTSQAAGTRNYGGTGGDANALYRCLAVEVLASTGTDATVNATAVHGTTSVPAATIAAGTQVTASAVVAIAGVPAPTVTSGTNATVTAVAVTAAAAVSAVSMASTVTPGAVAAVTALPTPSVSTSAGATVSAVAVHAATAVSAPTLLAGSVVTATNVHGVVSVPAATLAAGSALTATAVHGATAIPLPIVASHKYVVGASANGRYFVDQDGSPILIRGDSPWSMFIKLSASEVDTYLANRLTYGVNTLLLSMIGSTGNGGPNDNGATYDGVLPFTGGDPTVFNSTYWARMDSYIGKCRDAGITLMIYPIDGWTTLNGCLFDTDNVTTTQAQAYGNALATRYLSYPNIIWSFGGDYFETTPINDLMGACLVGIRAAGDTRPVTIQLGYETSESDNSAYWEPKVDWDFIYQYRVTYKGIKDGYDHSWSLGAATKPALFAEGAYEGSTDPNHPGTDLVIRRQAAWALTSGSPGDFSGQEGVWNFFSDWEDRLDTTAADQLKAIRDAVDGVAWWTLVPDDANALVTAGRGTRITTDSATYPTGNTYVTAARAADGTLAVVYLPNATSAITVSMAQIGSSPTATWVDPCNGATSSETVGSSYSHAGANSSGGTDWLLILTGLSGATVTAVTVTATTAVPAPAVVTGSTLTAAAVAAITAVPVPTVTTGSSVTVSAVAVAAVTGVPAATVEAGTGIVAAAVSASAGLPTPEGTTGSTVSAVAVAGSTGLPTPSVSGATGVTVNAVAVTATAAVPTVAPGVTITATAVTSVTAVPTPARTSLATVEATAVTGTAVVPAPSVSGTTSATVTAVSVGAVVTVPLATTLAGTGALIVAVAIAARAAIPGPLVAGIVNGSSTATVTGLGNRAAVAHRNSSTPGVSDTGVAP